VFDLDYPSVLYEVIIVNDASSDCTHAYCQKLVKGHSSIRYLLMEKNSGPGAARNFGLKNARGDLIAFLDDDCIVDSEWLTKIIQTLALFPCAAAVGGSIINTSNSPLAWAAYILEFSSWFPHGKSRSVHNVPTCNVAYRKKDIEDIFFVEKKNAGYEDALFNNVLRSKGRLVIFNPTIRVIHEKWNMTYTKRAFIKEQIVFVNGFLNGGYKVHGFLGYMCKVFPMVNFLCLRLIFVFFRCLHRAEYIKQFFLNFGMIFQGELIRSKCIYKHRKRGTLPCYARK
jgi:glycosyltransferase involved in cell wall biosynthesis